MPDVINQATAGLQNMNSVLQEGVDHSRAQEQIWSGMGKIWLLLEAGVLGSVLKTTKLGHQLHDAFSEARRASKGMQHELFEAANVQRAKFRQVRNELREMKAAADANTEQGKKEIAIKELELASERQGLRIANSRLHVQQAVKRINSANALFVSAAFTATFNTTREVQAMNRALISGNSALSARLDLSNQIFGIQALTGASARESAQIAAALTEYGLDMTGNFKENGVLISQLAMGLGLSADASARIVLYSNIHKTNARAIADAMVRVVESTALTASETERIVDAVQSAMIILRSGVPREDAAVSEYLARLEGRLKEVGGVQGEITRFYERVMTTTEGAGLGAMVGVMDPERLAGPEGTKMLAEGIQRMVENSTRGLTGTARIAQLEALSQITGLSVRTLSQYAEAMARTTSSIDSATTIEERWNRTVAQTGEIISVSVSRLYAILQRGLMPTLRAVFGALSWVNEGLGTLLNIMERYEATAKAVGTAIMTGAVVAFGVLLRQLGRVAQTALVTAAALQKQIMANTGVAASSLGGGRIRTALGGSLLAPTTRTFLPNAASFKFLGSAGFITAAAATIGALLAGVGIGTWIQRYFVAKPLREAELKLAHAEATAAQGLLDSTLKKARVAAGASDFETIDFLLKKVREDGFRNVAKLGVHDTATLEKQIIAEVANAANFKFAEVFRDTGGGMVSATKEQVQLLKQMLEYQKRATEGSEKYWEDQSEGAKKAREEMQKKAAEEAEDRRRETLKNQSDIRRFQERSRRSPAGSYLDLMNPGG